MRKFFYGCVMTSAGLRETKKAATRQALAVAMLRLSARDGFDTVSVEAVAAEVGVSARTFHNYFAGKEEALRFYLAEVISAIFSALESRPTDESFWDSTAAAFIEVVCDRAEDPRELVHLMTLMDTEPSVAMKKNGDDVDGDAVVARFEELCRKRSIDSAGVGYTRLVLGCAAVGVRVALESHVDVMPSRAELRITLQHTFDQIRSGLGTPLPTN